jgi:hypothetical protein
MQPTASQEVITNFWTALQNVAQEVLAQGTQYGYGYTMVEIKFKDNVPSVMINSHTESRLYRNQDEAFADITKLIQEAQFKGSQSFTLVREKDGQIKRLLIDEYSMTILGRDPKV